MVKDLKQKAAKGLVWKFIEQGGTQLIQFVSGIYIARILSPEDYGLVGMMAIFLGISQMFIDSGFRATLIQKGTDVTHDDYNVVFIFNISVSSIIYLCIYFGAHSIADFYSEPRLVPVARILGLNLIFLSLGIIHQTILEKKLNFRTLTKIRLLSVLVSVVAGVVLAVKGFGVWALVTMTIAESFVRLILIWWINKWYPTLHFRLDIFNELYKKGIQIFFAGILRALSENMFAMVIGKFFTTADVGFYSQGKKLQTRIGDFITMSFQSVMYPVQSLMKDDTVRLKNAVRKNVKIMTLLAFPAVIGLIVIAKPFITLFLTEKWLPSVYYLQILSVAGLFFIVRGAVNSHIMPKGKFNILIYLNFAQSFVLVFVLAVGIAFDVALKILVIGKIIQEFAGFLFAIYYAGKFIDYKATEIFKDILEATIFSTIMGIAVLGIGYIFETSFLVLFLQCAIGGITYVLLNYIFNKRLFEEIKPIFAGWISNRKT